MRSPILLKLAVLAFLVLLCSIPLFFITGLTVERRGYRDTAVRDIQQSSAGRQRLAGPILVVPYRVRTCSEEFRAGESKAVRVARLSDRSLVVLPDSLTLDATLALEPRYRGIYRTQLYRTTAALRATFSIVAPQLTEGEIADWGVPRLSMSVSDARGLRESPTIRWQGSGLATEPGSALAWMGPGFHALPPLEPIGTTPSAATCEIDLPLMGTESFTAVPIGRQTTARVASTWPHPQFTGSYLPDSRRVDDSGFDAQWKLSRLATDIEHLFEQSNSTSQDALPSSAFGVDLIEPLDTYRLTDRALKYGLLFVMLTFVAFLLFEILAGLHVHLVQYLLVAAALVLFFLLLLSLSEHVPYWAAYLVASGASVALISAYSAHVLASAARAAWLASGLVALYGFLFVVMRSQDYALLLGSVLTFAALASVMWSTRRVDWNRLGTPGA